MQLVADRFVVGPSGESVDLASGRRVHLVVSTAGAKMEQTAWAARCARIAGLRHRAVAALVDYGAIGRDQRFEAWRCDGRWRGAAGEAERAAADAIGFLRACGLTTGAMNVTHVADDRGEPVLLPPPDAGQEVDSQIDGGAKGHAIARYGLQVLTRRTVTAISEMFADSHSIRPRAIALWGATHSGLETAVREIARAARLQGFVPVAISFLQSDMATLLDGRTLLLICREEPVRGWTALLECGLRIPRAHVLLFAGGYEVPGVHAVPLEQFAPDALAQAVRPTPANRRLLARIAEAANRSGGRPGRFVDLLWGVRRTEVAPCGQSAPRAAEGAAIYGADAGTPSWPAIGELTGLRERLDAAIADLARGRHAPGDRVLRQVVGALARRHDWAQAARGSLALAESLLRRGCTREARAALADARTWAANVDRRDLLLEIAVLSGVAATDEAHLEEAETILHATVGAARGLADPPRARSANLALARCLFWGGRYADAQAALRGPEFDETSGIDALRRSLLGARVAVGHEDLSAAIGEIAHADRAAAEMNKPIAIATAAYGAAFVHLALGDLAAVGRDVASCIQAARAGRDPLLVVRARLIGAEAARRSGKPAIAAAQLAAVERIPKRQFPAILRHRHSLVADLLAAPDRADIVNKHVNVSGLKALALFVSSARRQSVGLETAVHDIVDILRCCQTADEDAAVLAAVCARLRTRLQAAGVAFFVEERGAFASIAAEGARIEPAIASRIATVEHTVAPHRADERIEGGAPVRYGGKAVGSLVARWSLGTTFDPTNAAVLLTTAATAAGPALAALAARRLAPTTATAWELLGASAAIDEVRRAIERAAPAPFNVLIEGESGSGKELVARALHRRGQRRDRPFATLNCAALPDDLVESELFGHARGAFTGAVAERSGVFEEAHSGTLFLDEIGELSMRAQAKVLRTIQEGELRRVGDSIARRVDVRLVAATNRDLRDEVANGRFRLDLLYRLDVIRIAVPPLRERRDDIPLLAEYFWREATARVGSKAALGGATLAALARYDWPGNVRELQNVLAALAVRSPKRGIVSAAALPPPFDGARASSPDDSWRLDEARRTFERRFIRAALARSGGHRARAAAELGVTRQGLTKLMVRLGIDCHAQP